MKIVKVTLTFDVFIENTTKETALKRVINALENDITELHVKCGDIKGFGFGGSLITATEEIE